MDLVFGPGRDRVSDDDNLSGSNTNESTQQAKHVKPAVKEAVHSGFVPAYYDSTTDTVYLSRYSDGSMAPVHVLDGIPKDLLQSGSSNHSKNNLVVGFVRDDRFYTREQAAKLLQEQSSVEQNSD